ncbi:DUF4440 domain-containing protein [Phenylobacterium sp.]|uniref:nuclear transport factor 2 family protein n=1 Tax=Phenylobacterium sp. TaxID=1871053 RepID=UPI0012032660|nr:DUF4440 domain-containing protein [Phenylobacterium sp.]THD63459.1 MAG: DUF4440 domain-containing protein [Phenylobacterium sp.]
MPLAAVFLALVAAGSAPPLPNDALAVALRAKDQALLDAIAPGERGIWEKTLAPRAVYIDENGAVMGRTAYLKSLEPLPPGASGHLTIVNYRLTRVGDTALVIHRDDEREDFHGLQLHADYLMSETWQRMKGVWRLAMVHVYVVAVDPPAIQLPDAALEAYVGTYAAGNDLTYVIRREGDHLLAGRPGGPMNSLLAEAPDVLFTQGQPRVRRLFQRDADGRVTGFIDRREGEDIVWRKTSAQ